MSEQLVYLIRTFLLFRFMEQSFIYNILYICILCLNNLLFVTSVHHIGDRNGMFLPDFFIVLQKLNGMPSHRRMGRIMCLHHHFQLGQLVFNYFPIIQYTAFGTFFIVMHHRMEQNIQAGSFCRRDRNHRDIPKQFRQAVQVDFHPPLLHNVHHIQGKYHWLAQL